MKFYFFYFIWCLTIFLVPSANFALSPLVQYNDLVAGEGEHGFEDGPFYSAQFNNPIGLALNDDGSILYVADCDNNRIRAIDLNNKDKVETLAGTGAAGSQNGLLSAATFNHPTELAFLGDRRLVVNDSGNGLFRLIDLKTKTISTLAGGGKLNEDGNALSVQLKGVYCLVYLPDNNCIYFSEPDVGKIKELNLKTGNITTVFQNDSSMSQPAALCVLGNNVYIADKDSKKIYKMAVTRSPKDGNKVKTSLELIESRPGGHKIVALAGFGSCLYGSGGSSLYAYDSEPVSQTSPINRIYPDDSGPITFVSAWGDVIAQASAVLPHFAGVASGQRVGFVADPRSEGRFYITNPANCVVASFRDLNFGNLMSDQDHGQFAREFTYPKKKPFKTYRILMTGWSYLIRQHARKWDALDSTELILSNNIMTLMSKRLEFDLNTLAALEDIPLHFEVLNDGQIVGPIPFFWPYYDTPKVVQDYNIDLVLMTVNPFDGQLEYYWHAPLNSEGVPLEFPDMEFVLKPQNEKFKSGILHDFFDLVEKKKMQSTPDKWNDWMKDPQLRNMMVDIIGRPEGLLQKKYNSIKMSSGTPCKLCLCYFPSASFSSFPSRTTRTLWKDVAAKNSLAFLDLTNDFIATRYTYFPFSDMIGTDHFSVNGHSFFAQILAYELIKNKIIPFNPAVSE